MSVPLSREGSVLTPRHDQPPYFYLAPVFLDLTAGVAFV